MLFSLFHKITRLSGCLVSFNSGTSESGDARGSRPNRNSNDVILEGSDESGRVRSIHHAGVTY